MVEGGPKILYTQIICRKIPPLLRNICAGAIWLTMVGGYMKGRKKSEQLQGMITVGLGALLTILYASLVLPFCPATAAGGGSKCAIYYRTGLQCLLAPF